MSNSRVLEAGKPPSRRGLFISYSHTDVKWLERIRTMLSPLIREDGIRIWDDTQITPGSKWRIDIANAIDSAQVALLLVRPSFLASRFIVDEELPRLLRAEQDRGLIVLWALISPCLYNKTAIAKFQAAHAISRPLDGLQSARRNQLLQIAEAVATALHDRNRSRKSTASSRSGGVARRDRRGA